MIDLGEHLFIVGTTFSGSTLLYRFLAKHRDLAWFSLYSLRDGRIPRWSRLPGARAWDRVGRRLFPHGWSKETHVSKWQRRYADWVPTPIECHPIWNHLLPGIERGARFGREDGDALGPRLMNVIDRALLAQSKRRFLAKRPDLMRAIDLLATIFPRAQFLHTIRDGRAVALTELDPKLVRGASDGLARIRARAESWRETIELASRFEAELGPDRFMRVHYEDLCEDVHGVLRRVLEFAHLARTPIVPASFPSALRCTNDDRIAGTHPLELATIEEVIAEPARRLGYPRS